MQTSDRALRAGRRGMLAGAAALTASTAVPTQPARAFIDLPSRLHNRYFLVRHGESTLDVRGQFLSNPSYKYDTTYGLTKKGIYQMHEAARIIADEYDAAPSWLYTSNFQRAFQSALILREDLGLLFSQLRTEFSGLLDPRKMGALDFDSQTKWPEVWAGDEKDAGNTPPPVPASLQPSASVESPQGLVPESSGMFHSVRVDVLRRGRHLGVARGHHLAVHRGDDGHGLAQSPQGLEHRARAG